MSEPIRLPDGVQVFERGWLSSNNILLTGEGPTTLVDSGYCTHAPLTVGLIERQLGDLPLDLLLNTHLHSDHCGGNAALQSRYPEIRTLIPPGHAAAARTWDTTALTYLPTGQECPRFEVSDILVPGSALRLGSMDWEIHAAPGHDPHSIVMFSPEHRILISADALWFNGFGVVFPELEGIDAFSEVGSTLDLIEQLDPQLVIPGHGPLFGDVQGALLRARQRLDSFVASPSRHARYAAKVLLKFKLLDKRIFTLDGLRSWAKSTSYLQLLHASHGRSIAIEPWLDDLVGDLVKSGAARLEGNDLIDV